MRARFRKLAAIAASAVLASVLVVVVDAVVAPPAFASSITVNTAGDPMNAGFTFNDFDNLCSLRGAMASAQANSNGGTGGDDDCTTGAAVDDVLDTIQIDPSLAGQTLTLSAKLNNVVQPLPEVTEVGTNSNPLKIIGPNLLATGFKISGGSVVRPFLVGHLQSGSGNLTLANLTVQNGNGANGDPQAPALNGFGGAMYASEGSHLTFDNAVFTNNSATQGGAIWAEAPTITNNGGAYSSNSASQGGAIYINSGPAIFNGYAMLMASNSASDKGGAIYTNPASANPLIHLERSLLRNNTSPANGGGVIYITPNGAPTGTTVEIMDSTITANSSVMFSTASTQRFLLERNTIKDTGVLFNGFGPSPVRNNIIWSTNAGSTQCFFTGPGGGLAYTGTRNLVKPFAQAGDCGINGLNPLGNVTNMSPSLAQNGGPEVQQTFALFSGSNAIDNANSTYCGTLDARSVKRGLDGNGILNNPQPGDCDIGAYEYVKYVVNWVTGTSSLNEGQGVGNIQAKLRILDPSIPSLPSALNVPVTYDNTSTAAKTIDFNSGANVTFPAGSVDGAVVNYPVTLIQDNVAELFGEEARFDLGSVAGVSIAEPKRHTMSIQDDDQPGVVVDDGGNGTHLAEATPLVGEDITVKLKSQPDRALLDPSAPGNPASYGPPADVTMNVEPDRDCIVLFNGDQATEGDPIQIVIPNAQWQSGKTLTIRSVNDLYDEDLRNESLEHDCVITYTFQSQDPLYNSTSDSYQVFITDNDVAGVNLVKTNSPGTLREGTSDVQSYDITLDTPPDPGKPLPGIPRTPTSINVNPGPLCDAGGGQGVVVSRPFTKADYNVEQSVSVGPADDLIVDLLHQCPVTLTVSGGDPVYNDLDDLPVFSGTPPSDTVTVQDYDPPDVTNDPPFAIISTSGGDGAEVSEDTPNSFDTVSVVLQRAPRTNNVTLNFTAADDVLIAGPQIKIAKLTAVPGPTASLTFTPANWNVPQLLEVHAVDDDYDEDDTHPWTFSVDMTSTAPGFSDANLRRFVVDGTELTGPADIPVTITDNDTSEVLADHTGGSTVITEAGGTDKVSITLATHPYQDVNVRVTTDAQCTVEGGSQFDVMVLAGDWNVAHEVTLAAVDDDDLETSPHPCAVHFQAFSDDSRYDSLTDDLTADVTDNEVPEVLVDTDNGVAVTEGGAGDSYTVVLKHKPSADVTVDFTNDAQSTTPASVTFTPLDWDTPKTVPVAAIDDDFDEADPHASSIGLGVTSTAIGYGTAPVIKVNNVVSSSIGVLVGDDDDTGIGFSKPSLLTLTESGADETYDVTLTSEPTDGVEVSLSTVGLCSVSPTTLNFGAGDWDQGHTVTVTPGNDDIQHAQTCQVKHLVTFTNDATYSALGPAFIEGPVEDDDVAGVQLSKASLTLDEGGADDTYTVVLTSQPEGAVDISLTATGLCTVAPTMPLTFDGATWMTPQTVTVTPGDDNLPGDTTCTIDHGISSTDPVYAQMNVPSISGTVVDDDVVGVVLSKTSLTLAEGGANDTYTVRLGAQPTADVTVTPTAAGLCSVSGAMTFTPLNYKQVQTVTVTPGDDLIDNSTTNTCTISHDATSADLAYDAVAISDASGPVVDDDNRDILVSKTNLTLTEAGADDTYTIVLATQPEANVKITLSKGGLCTVAPDTMTFTPADWMVAKTITVTPGDDDIVHNQVCTINGTPESTDTQYANVQIPTVFGPVADDDTARVLASKANLTLAEGGADDTYTLDLATTPLADVTVALSATGLCSVSPPSMTFSGKGAKTVTVTPGDNDIDDTNSCTVSYTVTSADPAYDGLSVTDTSGTVADDDTAGVQVTPTVLTLDEGGADGTYDVVLTSEPTADVTVSVAPSGLCTADTSSLTFTASDWDTAQTVTVTPGSDDLVHPQVCTITHAAASGDADYSGASVASVVVTVTDDDSAAVLLSKVALSLLESGPADTYTVVLTSEPTSNVTVTPSATGLCSVSGMLTFTPADWDTPQTVTVTPGNDDQVHAQSCTISHLPGSADDSYGSIPIPDISGAVVDDDSVAIIVSKTSLSLVENGADDTFTVRLGSKPTADVTVGTGSAGLCSVSGSMTFTSVNYAMPQTVTVTPGNDDVVHAQQCTITVGASSTDPDYDQLAGPDVSGAVVDDDTAGVTLSKTNLTLAEGGSDDTYTVVLTSQPTADVTITVSDVGLCSASPGTLMFTSADWNVAKTVTVTPGEDSVVHVQSCTVSHAAGSEDPVYDGISVADASGAVTDNDTAGVQASKNALTLAESGPADTYTLVLSSQPAADVTVALAATGLCSVGPASVTFTSANWDVAKTVTVTPGNDDIVHAQSCTVTHTVTSADADYDGDTVADATGAVTDDDVAGVVVVPTALTLDEGGADGTYDVVLTSEPTADVAIGVSPSGLCTTDKASLTFTSADWDTPQTVTVTPGSDDIDHAQSCTITHGALSGDGSYNGISVSTVAVTVTDDDAAGVDLSQTTLDLVESGAADTYTVVLTSEPTADVTITPIPAGLCSVSGAMVFTAADWDQAQTVTVTPGNDDQVHAQSCTISHLTSSADATYNGMLVPDVAGPVFDDDQLALIASKTVLTLAESGADDTYTLRLGSQPAADVVVTLGAMGLCTTNGPFTFTAANWMTTQAVIVTPGNDDVVHAQSCTISHVVTSADASYDGLATSDASGPVADDDTASVQLSKTNLTLAEGGADDSYTVVLGSQPLADVTIAVSEAGLCSSSPDTLTFTPLNWMTAQPVTVGADVDSIHHSQSCAVSHTATSSDPAYDGIPIATASGPVGDDDIAGVQASKSTLTLTESGADDTYTLKLSSQPAGDVTVALAATGLCSVGPASITFTSDDWFTPQTVTVTPGNDDIVHAQSCTVAHTVTSTDADYGGSAVPDATGAVADDDVAGVVVVPTVLTLDEGGADGTYDVVLTSEPTADVTISVTPTGLCSTDTSSLAFTPANWDTAQTVTVTPGSDDIDHVQVCTIPHSASSADPAYNGSAVESVTVNVSNDDVSGFELSKLALTLTESGPADTFTLVLTSEPNADVMVGATSLGLCSVTPSATFTPANWDVPQTFTVTPGNDDIVHDQQCAITFTTGSADSAYDNRIINSPTGPVADDDTAGVVITAGTVALHEAMPAATDTYTVVLTSEPTADVSVAITTADGQTTVDKPTLTFTAADWDVPQMVTVSVVDDTTKEASPHSGVIAHAVTSTDPAYDGAPIAVDGTPGDEVGVTIGDDETVTTVVLSAPTDDETPVTATATVAGGDDPRTGTVQFAVDGTDVGGPVAVGSDQATLDLGILAVGARTVTASYSGDATHEPSSGEASATVTIVPRAADDMVAVDEDTTLNINVLANDKGVTGITPSSWTQGAHGAVACDATTCDYTPEENFNGTDTFTYTATDGEVVTAAATVTVTVDQVNDAPSAQQISVTVVAGQQVTFNVLDSVTDVEGDLLTLLSYEQPAHGTVDCTSDGECTYTPDPGFTGTDSFTFVVSDGMTALLTKVSTARRPARSETDGEVRITVTPAPTTTTSSSTTTTTDGTGVGPGGVDNGSGSGAGSGGGTLGRTGVDAGGLVGLGLLLLALGALVLRSTRRRRLT